MKRKKYNIGDRIAQEWVIVAVLQRRNQNKKLLCYNCKKGIFKEAWIWDFTRNKVSLNPNHKTKCKLTSLCFAELSQSELYDINADAIFKQKVKTHNLSNIELVMLRNIREGICADVKFVLNTFSDLLCQSGQARRNLGLATAIGSTYEILNRKGMI